MSRGLPAGRVTFAFVDVVESTKTFAAHGDAFVAALAVLQERVARHTVAVGGSVVKTEGDGAFLAFGSAQAALDALIGLQAELDQVPDSVVPRLRLRAGAHTGDAVPVADDYVALAVNVAARVTSAAGAGQVVVSAATQAELTGPVGVCMGDYDLKDVPDHVELWRVCGDGTPLRAPPARRTNVRAPATGFVGRDSELAEVRDLVAKHRLVTVMGPGGLGKTRLVSELLLQIAKDVEGGAWLVELASLTSGDQISGAVAQVLGAQGAEAGQVAAEVRRRGEVMLVLDNCEHLIETVADLAFELLESCPTLTLVCTSREPVQVPGEHVWRLQPLSGQAARLELFTQRARGSGGSVPDGSAEAVDRLCTALDGLPLAIELAATQSGHTTLEHLIRIAEEGTDGLARRSGPSRQRSLDAVLAWSMDRLPEPHRRAHLVLSILPGRFDAEMATTILGAVEGCDIDAVRPLARASLIDLDGESYRILDTIRHAAQRQLSADHDLARAARRGLLTWALDLAAAQYSTRQSYEEVPSDRLLTLEIALERAMDDDAPGTGKLWVLVGQIVSYREPSGRVVELARRLLSEAQPADTDGMLSVSSAVDVLDRVEDVWDFLPRLEAMSTAASGRVDARVSARAHHILAWHYAMHGEVSAGRRHADAYAACVASPDVNGLADQVHELRSVIAYATGASDEVLLHAERFLLARRRSQHPQLYVAEINVAEALIDLGRAEEALPHALEALRLSPRPRPARRYMLLQLARAHHQLGNTEAAQVTVEELAAELLASGRPPERIRSELEQLEKQLPGLVIEPSPCSPRQSGPTGS
jgi:predicted ATPase/class 3 adenylate cyclase